MKTIHALIICLSGLASTVARAAPEVSLGHVEMESDASAPAVPAVPGAIDAPDAAPAGAQGGKRGEWVIAPLPSRSPLIGWSIALPVLYLYRPPGADPDDDVWMTGVSGLASENDSWGVGAFHRMSIGGDRWRIQAGAFNADIAYDFYGIGGDGSAIGIPIFQPTKMVTGEVLREVAPKLYVGLSTTRISTEIGLDIDEDLLPPGIVLPTVDLDLATVAPTIEYDTRDSTFYPTEGIHAEAKVALGRDALGSDVDYEKYAATLNHYRSLSERSVLASRVAIEYAAGDAPFFMYPAFGAGADLRGYQTGTYRDRFLLAVQAEYRRKVTARIGAVAFAGIGTVAPEFGKWEKSLSSIGTGLRYTLGRQNTINLRIDVARGRDETVWYVGLREAF